METIAGVLWLFLMGYLCSNNRHFIYNVGSSNVLLTLELLAWSDLFLFLVHCGSGSELVGALGALYLLDNLFLLSFLQVL